MTLSLPSVGRVLVGAAAIACLLLFAPAGRAAPAKQTLPGPHYSFEVTREADATLPNHTLFRPTDLEAPRFKLPVVLWANGGCRESNEEYRYFLTNFAKRGYFVVANGAPENPYRPEEVDGMAVPQPEQLRQSLDWVTAQTTDPSSRYFDLIDASRIAMMGQSCGGYEVIDASDDPRVDSLIVWNNGSLLAPGRGDLAKLNQPVAFLVGAFPADYVSPAARATYPLIPEDVPTVLATRDGAGHTNWWDDPNPSDGVTPALLDEPLLLAQKWLELTLYGQLSGRDFYLGADCELCRTPGWTEVWSKQWEAFALAPSPAPRRR